LIGGIEINIEDKYLLINKILLTISNLLGFIYLIIESKIEQLAGIFFVILMACLIISLLFLIYSYMKTKEVIPKPYKQYYLAGFIVRIVWLVVLFKYQGFVIT
jgi:membrane-bound ClpP family serine protease